MSLFRSTVRLLSSHSPAPLAAPFARTKLTTTVTGLAVHPSPLPALVETYHATLAMLQPIPAGALYRQTVESITNERLAIVDRFATTMQGEQAIEAVEDAVGMGCVEELIVMAECELKLVGKMLEWCPWEELEVKAAPGQWEQFGITPSTTTAEDLVKKQ